MNHDRTFAPWLAALLTLAAAASVCWLLAIQIDGIAGFFASIVVLRQTNEDLSRTAILILLFIPLMASYWQFYRNGRWKPAIWVIVTIPGAVIGAVFCLPVVWIWPLLSNELPPGWFAGWLLSLGLTLPISSLMTCRRPLKLIVVAGIPLIFILYGALTDYDTVTEHRDYGELALLSVTQMVLSATVWIGTWGSGFALNSRMTRLRIPFLEKSVSGENASLGRARTVAFAGAAVLLVAQSYMAVPIALVGLLAFDSPERAQWLARASVTAGGFFAILGFVWGVDGIFGYLRLVLIVVVPIVAHRQLRHVELSDVQPIDSGFVKSNLLSIGRCMCVSGDRELLVRRATQHLSRSGRQVGISSSVPLDLVTGNRARSDQPFVFIRSGEPVCSPFIAHPMETSLEAPVSTTPQGRHSSLSRACNRTSAEGFVRTSGE